MRGKNLGMSKAMALDTLGNAYLHLRETYATTPWSTTEGNALLAAAEILRTAFSQVKQEFRMYDFTY